MRLLTANRVVLLVASACLAGRGSAQASARDVAGPRAGDVAPDFTLPASTRAGLLPAPVHLADLKGQVVVLAFFPKARTSG